MTCCVNEIQFCSMSIMSACMCAFFVMVTTKRYTARLAWKSNVATLWDERCLQHQLCTWTRVIDYTKEKCKSKCCVCVCVCFSYYVRRFSTTTLRAYCMCRDVALHEIIPDALVLLMFFTLFGRLHCTTWCQIVSMMCSTTLPTTLWDASSTQTLRVCVLSLRIWKWLCISMYFVPALTLSMFVECSKSRCTQLWNWSYIYIYVCVFVCVHTLYYSRIFYSCVDGM